MAKQTVIRLTDDIDGSEATESVSFALRGTGYQIDLNAKNVAALEKALAKFIAKSRRVPVSRTVAARSGRAPRRTTDAAAVRDWARANGFEVSGRGRIQASVRAAYDEAN